MSKRISNKRTTRKTPARSRVRLGWHKQQIVKNLDQLSSKKDAAEQLEIYLEGAKKILGKFVPARFYRKQAR